MDLFRGKIAILSKGERTMNSQTYEGTVTELRSKLLALPLKPGSRLKMIVSEMAERVQTEEEYFANPQTRNGFILVPTKCPDIEVTLEMVNALSED